MPLTIYRQNIFCLRSIIFENINYKENIICGVVYHAYNIIYLLNIVYIMYTNMMYVYIKQTFNGKQKLF